MASMTKNNSTWTYTYDSNGLRTGRTNGVTSYEYVYSGDLLKQMTVTDVASGAKQVLTFTYDASGVPLTLDLDGTVYYYLTNIQGDVTGIVDADGNILIQYVYEGYGKSYFINDTSDLTVTLGSINPLAYRAYVFDMGTALYYLQSRYYDQFLGRFLNADAFVSTGQGVLGYNMFAYCGNNPICRVDYSGDFWGIVIAIGIVVAAASLGVGITHICNKSNENKIEKEIEDSYTREEAKAAIEDTLSKYPSKPEVIYNDTREEIRITDSVDVISKYDRQKTSMIIARTDGLTDRSSSNLSAEWEVHNFLYGVLSPINNLTGWFSNTLTSLREVDLDYVSDRRPALNFVTGLFEVLGWE